MVANVRVIIDNPADGVADRDVDAAVTDDDNGDCDSADDDDNDDGREPLHPVKVVVLNKYFPTPLDARNRNDMVK